MVSRRQQKVARVVKEVVSDAIANRLSDPRIEGFISVTKVEMAPNLRDAEIYISIFGSDQTAQKKTFIALSHATSRMQSLLAHRMQSKFCPVLHLHMDEGFKKTLEVMKIIDEAVGHLKEKDSIDQDKD